MNTYKIGQVIRLTDTVENSAGTDIDPANLTFTMREPDGVQTSYVYNTDAQLVRSATGIYYVDWPIAKEGVHAYRFATASGTGRGANENKFKAEDSPFF